MMNLEVTLTSELADRLYAIKEQQGEANESIERFAQRLLERKIRELHPKPVRE